MVKNRILTFIFSVATVLLIISVSIALPIYIRPFYYAHIEPLSLETRTGESAADIRASYDEVLDYLTLPWCRFGTGVFSHSAEGASHFADCRVLFLLNGAILVGSLIVTIVLIFLAARHKWKPSHPFGHHILLTIGVVVLAIVLLLAILISLDFERAFNLFHRLFFPGKDNWTFNPYTDEIILALPWVFFRNCAILIGSSIVILSVVCIIIGWKRGKNKSI